MATIAELLYLFRDGQAAKTIGPEAFQAMISELHLATGLFQDLPSSSAGLAYGRLYLNGGIVQMSTGGITASPNGNFVGVATAAFLANASFTRRAARSTIAISASLFADPVLFILPIPNALFVGSGVSSLFTDAKIRTAGSKDGDFLGSGAGSLTSNGIRTPLGEAPEAGAGNLTATVSWASLAGNAAAAGSAAALATPSSRRTTNATADGIAVVLAAPISKRRTNAPVAGSAAVLATPISKRRTNATAAGSSSITATPTLPSRFSSAFSSAFG